MAAEQDGLLPNSSQHSITSLVDLCVDGASLGRSFTKAVGRNKQQESCMSGPTNMTDAIMRVVEMSGGKCCSYISVEKWSRSSWTCID